MVLWLMVGVGGGFYLLEVIVFAAIRKTIFLLPRSRKKYRVVLATIVLRSIPACFLLVLFGSNFIDLVQSSNFESSEKEFHLAVQNNSLQIGCCRKYTTVEVLSLYRYKFALLSLQLVGMVHVRYLKTRPTKCRRVGQTMF